MILSFAYVVGKKTVGPFDKNKRNQCFSGIHFYITRVEAENY